MTFDEGYGKDPGFRSRLEEAGERYLGEVAKGVRVWWQRPVAEEPGRGRTGRPRHQPRVRAEQPASQTVEQVAATRPARAWQRLAFRAGTKGTRHAEFARLRVSAERDDLPGPALWLVVERSLDQELKVKYYLSNAAPEVSLRTLAQVGHTRWPVDDCFWQGKQEVGLDAYEVRSWLGWHHHLTLVMLALWFLKLETQRWGEKAADGVTWPDVRRLLQVLLAPEPPRDPLQRELDISAWRQRRNRRARECHARMRRRRWRHMARREPLRKTG